MEKIWLKQYPPGVPENVDVQACASLVALMEDSFVKYRDRCAYRYMGRSFSFGEVDEMSRALAAYLQGAGLAKGDRVALMMPNVPQYPVAVAAVLRAGCVVVNVNPLYTPRELEHQIKDSGARAIVVIENFATTLQHALPALDLSLVVVTALGDLLGFPRAAIVNFAVRRVKKMVPAFDLPGAVR
jgi:long-chain acyl-CoA synthetase